MFMLLNLLFGYDVVKNGVWKLFVVMVIVLRL